MKKMLIVFLLLIYSLLLSKEPVQVIASAKAPSVYSEGACPYENDYIHTAPLECAWSVCWDNNDPWRGDLDSCEGSVYPFEFEGYYPSLDFRDYDCADEPLTCRLVGCNYTYGACHRIVEYVPCSQCPMGRYGFDITVPGGGSYSDICIP